MKKEIYENEIPYSSRYWEDNPLFARWFIFGRGVNTCDISDGEGNIFITVPIASAEKICEIRNEFVDKIEAINRESGGDRRMLNPPNES